MTRPGTSIPTKGGLLPQLGAIYRWSSNEELFANFSQNVNAFPYSPQTGVYNTNAAAFDYFRAHTDPEKATTYEVGLRTRRDGLEASLAVYNIDYVNRLVGVAVCPLTATCVSSFANVGSITSRGVEGLLSLRLTDDLSWTTSASVNDATIDGDYVASPGDTVHSGGKSVVDAPKFLVNSGLRLARRGLTGGLNVRSVAKRYFSILNDQAVPAYTTVDASLGYDLGGVRALRGLFVQLNAVNLLDKSYVSTVGTGGFTVSGDTQTLMAGPRRLIFVTVGTRF